MKSISICIASKNRIGLLETTLSEVNSQALNNNVTLPVIICDDGSSKSYSNAKMHQKFPGLSILLVRNQTSNGLSAARNQLIQCVSTEYLIFLDDDDIWPRGFLNSFIFQNLADVPASVDAVIGYNDPVLKFGGDVYINSFDLVRDMYLPPVGCQIYKVESLKRNNIQYDLRIKSGVDHDLFFEMSRFNLNFRLAYTQNLISLLSLSDDRITTNFAHREVEIKKSISIWRGRLDFYDMIFWTQLLQGYQLHNSYKKFRLEIKRLNLNFIIKNLTWKIFRYLMVDILYRSLGFRMGKKLRK